MKRFYTAAAAEPGADGHRLLLDGRAIRTPRRAPLVVPSAALADAIAAEWNQQADEIVPQSMPLTGIANAAIDLVGPDMTDFAAPLAAYGGTDLLCYRAEQAPLAAVEAASWNPILAWAEHRFGVEFVLVAGIVHVPQPPATLAALEEALLGLDPFRLAAMAPLVTISGSLVIGLAAVEAAFAADRLWDAVVTDEVWQEQQWGVDEDAVKAREHRRQEWLAALRFVGLLRV